MPWSFSNPHVFYDKNRSFRCSIQDSPYFMTLIHFFCQGELSNFLKLISRNLIFLYLTCRPSLPNSKLLSLPLQKDTLFKTLTSETADNFRKCETKVDSNKPNLVEAYSKGFRPHVEFVLLLCSTMEFRLFKCLHCLTKKKSKSLLKLYQ